MIDIFDHLYLDSKGAETSDVEPIPMIEIVGMRLELGLSASASTLTPLCGPAAMLGWSRWRSLQSHYTPL